MTVMPQMRQRRALLSCGQGIAAAGQGEIFFRQASGVVRGKGERDFVPTDIHIRMMLELLGQFGDRVDKFHGGRKVFELKGAGDGLALPSPEGQGEQGLLDLPRIRLKLAGGKKLELRDVLL